MLQQKMGKEYNRVVKASVKAYKLTDNQKIKREITENKTEQKHNQENIFQLW